MNRDYINTTVKVSNNPTLLVHTYIVRISTSRSMELFSIPLMRCSLVGEKMQDKVVEVPFLVKSCFLIKKALTSLCLIIIPLQNKLRYV